VTPRLVTADELTEPYDVILLSVMADALEPTLDDLATRDTLTRGR
jgi:2-dehydropantoate 2-reductase